jgi:Alkylated DNA repair protein
MSNCGPLGWISDRDGYRYSPDHPISGVRWPPMPARVLDAWDRLAGHAQPPEACLINYYAPTARMGLHQDKDEESFVAPVLSLSLGDTCLFRFGGVERRGPTKSVKLASGDALIIGGAARLAFHGVDRILGGSSSLLAEGGRFNLTVRRVSAERHETPPSATR